MKKTYDLSVRFLNASGFLKIVKKITCISVIFFIVTFSTIFAQDFNNLRQKTIKTISDSIIIDSLSIIPSSVQIYDQSGNHIMDSLYIINFSNSSIRFNEKKIQKNQEITISYRVFPYNFSQTFFHKDYDKIILGPEFKKPITYKEEVSFNPFLNEKIEKSGNISRGISFGNNQDVIVNSNLNLQLSGKLDNNLNIVAAITDENIPIQPDGYTQQIQEFDKVYINIFNESVNTTAGDFELIHDQGYFLRADKKGQGGIATINTTPGKKNKNKYTTTFSGAIAKGRFAKNQLDAIEGNQGPYRLYGANNEMYIIILAGTEKVYMDGKLLKRGEDEDYIMNYNSAEIIFTTNHPITKDKRIIVEFEYSDRNYARFMVYNHHLIETKKGEFWINIYNEQDVKNQPLHQDLTDEDKQMLSSIGDNLGNAIVPNYRTVDYNNEFVRYKRVYIAQYNDSAFIYSINPDSAIYKVGFSFVGENNGNYIQDISAANGKVFKWVPPENGIKQGMYEPVSLLVTPKKQQLITFGYDFNITRTLQSFVEIGVSNNDLNTFSSIQNDDNTGIALKLGLVNTFFLNDSGKTGLTSGIDYEFNDYKFRPIERYKPVEYERDWNLQYNPLFEKENLISIKTDYFKNELGTIGYKIENLNKGFDYKALKNGLNINLLKSGFNFAAAGSKLTTTDSINNTSFLRYNGNLSKTISKLIIGIKEETEYNQWHNNQTDSLTFNSYKFDQYNVYAGYGDSLKNYTELSYGSRLDKLPLNNQLKNASLSKDINLKYRIIKDHTTFKTGITYRKLHILDTLLSSNEETETVIGRIENYSNFINRAINTSTFYEVGTGMEQVKEFSYIKVVQGEGIYTWNDYNNNNVQELDEFEMANFSDEANYIRVFVPTNHYEKIYFNQFSQSLILDPYRVWSQKSGLKKTISKFSNDFSFRVSQKNKDISIVENLNPFLYTNSNYISQSLNTSIKNSFAFNKNSSDFWTELIHLNSKNNLLLINGIDKKSTIENKLQIYSKIKKGIYVNGYTSILNKKSNSEYFQSKNYSIINQSNRLEVQFQINSKSQLNTSYLNNNKRNENAEEKLTGHIFGAEYKTSLALKGLLLANANYIKLQYNAAENSPIAYEMLEGLRPGNNYTWSVSLRKNLVSGLVLQLNYEGRSSNDSKVIHIGGIQIRANF